MLHPAADTKIEVKNLSTANIKRLTFDDTVRLCKVFTPKNIVPILFEKGKAEGIDVKKIRDVLIDDLGIEYRTIMRYAPAWSKGPQKPGPRKVDKLSTYSKPRISNATLVLEKEPEIPPMPIARIHEQEPEPSAKQLTEVKLPLSLADQLNKFMLARLIGIARGASDDYIILKVDKDGILYL